MAIQNSDGKALGAIAHSVKSSVGVFGAAQGAEAAVKVEMAGRHGDPATAIAAAPALLVELNRLAALLAHPIEAGKRRLTVSLVSSINKRANGSHVTAEP